MRDASGVAVDPLATVRELCTFRARLAGTDAERRAAGAVAGELGGEGWRVDVEPTYVQPQWALVHLLHCAIAAIGSMIAALEPAVSFAIVLVTATSAYLDLSGRAYLLRRLLFRRASQNVHARAPGTPADYPRVVLCANLDAPRTGAAYGPLAQRLQARAARAFPVASAPTRIWFWSIALLLPPLGARMAGLDANWLAVAQLPQTLILIVTSFLLGEIALSGASPGANLNASGVAAALTAARRLRELPPAALAVELAICGGGETSMQGMREFVRAHQSELERDSTWFVSLEAVGRGSPRFCVSQGPAVSVPLDRELVSLAEAIALTSEEDGIEPLRTGGTSAAYMAAARRYPALAITCREGDTPVLPEGHHTSRDTAENLDPASIEAAASFAEQLVRLLDRDVARRRSPERAEPVPA